MKTLHLLLLFCCFQFAAMASGSQNVLVVWQKDGSKAYFDLAERPKTTFAGANLVISTAKTTVSYPLANILRYTYEDVTVGVSELKTGTPYVYLRNNYELVANNIPKGTLISIYAVDGKLYASQRALGDQQTVLSLKQAPAGVYVVKSGYITYKIMKP